MGSRSVRPTLQIRCGYDQVTFSFEAHALEGPGALRLLRNGRGWSCELCPGVYFSTEVHVDTGRISAWLSIRPHIVGKYLDHELFESPREIMQGAQIVSDLLKQHLGQAQMVDEWAVPFLDIGRWHILKLERTFDVIGLIDMDAAWRVLGGGMMPVRSTYKCPYDPTHQSKYFGNHSRQLKAYVKESTLRLEITLGRSALRSIAGGEAECRRVCNLSNRSWQAFDAAAERVLQESLRLFRPTTRSNARNRVTKKQGRKLDAFLEFLSNGGFGRARLLDQEHKAFAKALAKRGIGLPILETVPNEALKLPILLTRCKVMCGIKVSEMVSSKKPPIRRKGGWYGPRIDMDRLAELIGSFIPEEEAWRLLGNPKSSRTLARLAAKGSDAAMDLQRARRKGIELQFRAVEQAIIDCLSILGAGRV